MENIVRVVPERCLVEIDPTRWPRPAIFNLIAEEGGISEEEMLTAFNCGIGMALIVPVEEVDEIPERLHGLGETAWLIGTIGKREDGGKGVVFKNGLEL